MLSRFNPTKLFASSKTKSPKKVQKSVFSASTTRISQQQPLPYCDVNITSLFSE